MKTMDKEFVPYDLALELKTLGFDEPCLGFYDGKGDSKLYFNNLRDASGDFKPFIRSERLTWFGTPTFSQAFRWFREKHELHSHISLGISDEQDRSGLEYDEYIYIIEGLNDLTYDNYRESPFYKTHEEAELACLRKLIEIVKK